MRQPSSRTIRQSFSTAFRSCGAAEVRLTSSHGRSDMLGWTLPPTPRPTPDHAEVTAAAAELANAETDRRRAELRQTWTGLPGALAAAIEEIVATDPTATMREATIESVW